VADVPAGLSVERNRDLAGLETRPWTRRVLVAALAAVLVAALLNLFGQRPTSAVASASTATIAVHAPTYLRSGLIFQNRITVSATEELERATAVLDRGWLEGITINTIEPAPLGEASRDGRLVLELGRVPAGEEHVLYLQMQVNPTTFGRRSAGVVLEDRGRRLARVDRTLTIWP
jgi:hypothetical protein